MVFKPRCDVWKYFDNIKEEGYASCKLCKQRMKNNRTYCLRQHLKRVHNTKSKIWKYFDNIVGEGQAECKECKQRVRSNRSSNFTRHMEKYHNIIICDIQTAPMRTNKKRQIDETIMSMDKTQSGVSSIHVTNGEPTGEMPAEVGVYNAHKENLYSNVELYKEAHKVLDIEMDETIVKSAVWGLMIDEGVTPSLFGSKNMQSLINPICDAISIQAAKKFKIDDTESETVLYSVANRLRNEFTNNLQWRLLSLKIHTDLGGPENYFCVSVSFVDEGSVQTRFLEVIEIKDQPHLSEHHIKQVIYKFNIDPNQIIYACWDNTKPKYNIIVNNSMYLQEINNLEKYPTIHISDIKIERYVGTTAHLCLLDIFKNSDIFDQFLNCRNFVKFITNEANGFCGVLKQNNLNIPELDSPWKWGSTYQMFYDLHEARKILENKNYPILQDQDGQFDVKDNLWLFVEAFCISVKFIQKSITKFYTEEMHFGDWYAQWLKSKLLTEKLAKSNDISNMYVSLISSQLLKSIEKRSSDILSKDVFQACLYMDPRFQHTLNLQEKSKAIEYLKNIWNRSKIYNPAVTNAAMYSRQEIVQSPSFDDDEDAFLNEFLCQDAQETGSSALEVYTKIEGLKLPFTSVETNILLFWNKKMAGDPEIFSLSEICFAIPTTQNYNKSLYTHLYQMQNNSKLPPLTKDNLISVRLNSHLLEGAPKFFGSSEEEKYAADKNSPKEVLSNGTAVKCA